MHSDVARTQLSEQRRVAKQHFHVAGLAGQLHSRCAMLKERALGSNQPYAELICFVSHLNPSGIRGT